MGGVCCVAVRDKDVIRSNRSSRGAGEILFRRDVGRSPTWSFQWGSNGRRLVSPVEDASDGVKGELGSVRGVFSDAASAVEGSFGTPFSIKSLDLDGIEINRTGLYSELSVEGGYSTEVKNLTEMREIADFSLAKLSYSPDSSFFMPVDDHSPSSAHPLPPNSTPSRWARGSPGHWLSRQISDSRILGWNSPNGYSLSERRSSFVLSTGSHDLATGSLGGSSDRWSVRTFSELVASSQQGRWSFDSDPFGSVFYISNECSSRFSHSPSLDAQTCAACSKLLTENSVCSSQRIMDGNDLRVVSVLVCGHLYHAECLEAMTPEVDKHDPGCPICMGGEKPVSNMSKKPPLTTLAKLKLKSLKVSRNRVIDSSLDSDSDEFFPRKDVKQEEALKMDPSSSAASSSSSKLPFLRRHFTFARKRRGV